MGGNQNSFVKMHETPLNQNRKHVYLQGNDATMQWTSNGCISGALFSSLFPRGAGEGSVVTSASSVPHSLCPSQTPQFIA